MTPSQQSSFNISISSLWSCHPHRIGLPYDIRSITHSQVRRPSQDQQISSLYPHTIGPHSLKICSNSSQSSGTCNLTKPSRTVSTSCESSRRKIYMYAYQISCEALLVCAQCRTDIAAVEISLAHGVKISVILRPAIQG